MGERICTIPASIAFWGQKADLLGIVPKTLMKASDVMSNILIFIAGYTVKVLEENGLLKEQTDVKTLVARHGLRHIRFHDLRHTCASLLLKNGVPMKQIQEWLGHSDFSTTANIYAHLDYNSKLNSAQAMMTGMSAALITVG